MPSGKGRGSHDEDAARPPGSDSVTLAPRYAAIRRGKGFGTKEPAPTVKKEDDGKEEGAAVGVAVVTTPTAEEALVAAGMSTPTATVAAVEAEEGTPTVLGAVDTAEATPTAPGTGAAVDAEEAAPTASGPGAAVEAEKATPTAPGAGTTLDAEEYHLLHQAQEQRWQLRKLHLLRPKKKRIPPLRLPLCSKNMLQR